jgi:DNA-binding Xre family transcriptional regulator
MSDDKTTPPLGVRTTHILRAMSERAVTTADLAAHIGIGEVTLLRRLTAESQFTVAELYRVGEYLGCSLSDLIGGSDEIEEVARG